MPSCEFGGVVIRRTAHARPGQPATDVIKIDDVIRGRARGGRRGLGWGPPEKAEVTLFGSFPTSLALDNPSPPTYQARVPAITSPLTSGGNG